MLVVRYTHTAKPGCRDELVKLLKGWVEGSGVQGQVLTPGYADFDMVELDVEWETGEDSRRFWADYDRSQPGVAEFHEKLAGLRETGSTRVEWWTQ
jgi:hypothetical protein